MTGIKLSKEAKTRIQTMVETNDGFKIAETDLKLRGPGDLTGTRQSGALDLRLSDLTKDGAILQIARDDTIDLIKKDPKLTNHPSLKAMISKPTQNAVTWGDVS